MQMPGKSEDVLIIDNVFTGIDLEAHICLESKAVDELTRLSCARVKGEFTQLCRGINWSPTSQ